MASRVRQKAFGRQGIEAKKPMALDAIFRIASMSKAVTSVAVMMLYEEGHFRLHDPVSKFIPGFKDAVVAVAPSADHPALPGKTYATVPAEASAADSATCSRTPLGSPTATASPRPITRRRT
jgi:CubicO group peptidase (beta-lactamase class C family)